MKEFLVIGELALPDPMPQQFENPAMFEPRELNAVECELVKEGETLFKQMEELFKQVEQRIYYANDETPDLKNMNKAWEDMKTAAKSIRKAIENPSPFF